MNVAKLAHSEHWNVVNSVNHEHNCFECNNGVYIIYREGCEKFSLQPKFYLV